MNQNHTAYHEGDRIALVDVRPRGDKPPPVVPCAKGRKPTAASCHDDYVDANAMPWKDSPCYRCAEGLARREALAAEGRSRAVWREGVAALRVVR